LQLISVPINIHRHNQLTSKEFYLHGNYLQVSWLCLWRFTDNEFATPTGMFRTKECNQFTVYGWTETRSHQT